MRTLAILLVTGGLALPAVAAPGVTTTNVNFRAGPGTDFESFGVLPPGTPIEIVDCEEGTTWCSVLVDDEDGFISGNYIKEVSLGEDDSDVVGPDGDFSGIDDELFTTEELDNLVARIALYPDNLIAQILVAATYPLDVVKAADWVGENTALPDDERQNEALEQGWDESVAILAAGFPTVITMMSDDIDWTEELGDAMVDDDEAVLAAIQRQRARAEAVGNLETNEAQTVDTVDNQIIIEPAEPDKVYIPAYNPQTVYETPAPSAPVYVSTTDSDWNTGAAIAGGAIAFGAGVALGSVFNNNYIDYWYGPPRVYWDRGYFYPRPRYRPPPRPGWGRWDRPRPGRPGRPLRPVQPLPGEGLGAGPGRPGAGAWSPNARQRQRARRNVERRRNTSGPRRAGNRRPGNRGPNANAVERKLKAGNGRPAAKRAGGQRNAAPRKANRAGKGYAKPRGQSAAKTKRAANRGKRSAGQRRANAPRRAQQRRANRPRQARAPQRQANRNRSAMRRPNAGRRANAHRARGNRSRGGRRGGRRR